jgi:predicted nuclease of predicted toxin-antitoxin system
MIRLLADENFDNNIIRALHRENADVDIIRVQDTQIYQADDSRVLEWAASEGRILLTHDVRTMPHYAYERVRDGQPMLGIIAVHRSAPIGKAIEDLLIALVASEVAEFEGQVLFIPIQ